jgi:hypothetical protein
VISDGYGYTYGLLYTKESNHFITRFNGGHKFFTNNFGAGVVMNAGDSAWSSMSDRNMKGNLRLLDPVDSLIKLEKLPLYYWKLKTENNDDTTINTNQDHLGPMAQDFNEIFFPEAKNHCIIHTADMDGIILLCIQALSKLIEVTNKKIIQNVTSLNEFGEACVVIDDSLDIDDSIDDSLNIGTSSFKYQLQSIGAAAPNLHIGKEVYHNSLNGNNQRYFNISGGLPNSTVHWQISY